MLRSSLLHAGWQLSCARWLRDAGKLGCAGLEWLSAAVPGHVHLDLWAQGVMAHPFQALHELGAQWVDDEDWCYRLEFLFRPDPKHRRRVLRFEGLDTVCSVSLNGAHLAQHDNMFVPLELDVSEALQNGPNELRIDFRSAVRTGLERRSRYFEQEGLEDPITRFEDRAFVRKAQYMFGWDWGPRLVSAGICGEVRLLEHGGRLLDVRVLQRHSTDGRVELAFESEFDADGEVIHFIEGQARAARDGETVPIEKPELWWPVGLGPQRLYTIRSFLVSERCATLAEAESSALDSRTQRIGLRSARLVREEDAQGESFEIEVNGKRVWAVGANWIPDHSFPTAVTPQRYREQLLRARDLNMNLLRVWGGGLYETEAFYDACDELGLLVWQDFPYACSYYPDDAAAQGVAETEARSAVKRLRQHASLLLWCGNNENRMMFEDKWGDAREHPPRYYGQAIYEEVLPRVLSELDPERPYIPSSPWGGQRANAGGIGDQHYWDVWHGRGDWKFYEDSRGRFVSEFGFAASPSHAAWRATAPAREDVLTLDVRHPIARFHDKTAKGYETFIGYVELHYPPATNLEEWAFTSQLNQRDALRHAIEHFRRSDFCKGALIWQLNDCWPVQSWSVLDSLAEYKAAAFELRRLYAPLLLSLKASEQGLELWVILDNAHTGVSGSVELAAHSLADGRVVRSERGLVELAPGERRLVLEVRLDEFELESTLFVARFNGQHATLRLLCEPKDARLAEPGLSARFEAGVLSLHSELPVVDLFLWDPTTTLHFEKNFLSLIANERTELRVSGAPRELRARSLRGVHRLRFED